MKSSQYRQAGFGMIEVIIAMVVLSVGLLSMAGLQMRALAGNHNAGLRMHATMITDDLIERMRSNRSGVDDNYYSTLDTNNVTCTGSLITICSDTSLCSAENMAKNDVLSVFCGNLIGSDWYHGLEDSLPEGRFSIVCNDRLTSDADPCTGGSSFTVTVSWNTLRRDAASAASTSLEKSQFVTTIRP